jgi:alpha-tubulin suppressor-like RCC1 family protein
MGGNYEGQLGALGGIDRHEPETIENLDRWTAISAGDSFSCGLRADGEAWCWGSNRHGNLGDNGGGIAKSLVEIDRGPFRSVHVAAHTNCAIHEDGSLWCWGANAFGQIGDGSTYERRRPVRVGEHHDWNAVALSLTTTCGLRGNTLWCWGDNRNRQLGVGGLESSSVPIQVGTQDRWTEIALDRLNACGVLDNQLYCWGAMLQATPLPQGRTISKLRSYNRVFLGIEGSMLYEWESSPMMTPDTSVAGWDTADVGGDHTCGLLGAELWCYGYNQQGQLGSSPAMSPSPPVREVTVDSWKAVDVGGRASCGITVAGRLACWGSADLIAGGPGAEDTFAPLTIGSDSWKSISVGEQDACGVRDDGVLFCWGTGNISARGDARGGHERPVRVSPP